MCATHVTAPSSLYATGGGGPSSGLVWGLTGVLESGHNWPSMALLNHQEVGLITPHCKLLCPAAPATAARSGTPLYCVMNSRHHVQLPWRSRRRPSAATFIFTLICAVNQTARSMVAAANTASCFVCLPCAWLAFCPKRSACVSFHARCMVRRATQTYFTYPGQESTRASVIGL